MFPFGKRKTAPSARAHQPRVTLEALGGLQPLLLLQVLVGISHTVNGGVSRSGALARALLLSGQQRLHGLLAAAPRLHLPVEQVLQICRASDVESTPEGAAARALLELCLGLILQWMARCTRQACTAVALSRRQPLSLSYILSFPPFYPLRARSCLHLPLA